MIKIRLQRHGARHAPFIMVVAPSTSRRDGRFIEVLGTYDPQAIRVLKNSDSRWIELIIGFKLEHNNEQRKV